MYGCSILKNKVMKMTRVFCLGLLMGIAFIVGLSAQTKDELSVRDVVMKNAEAFEKGDLALMDKIWLDDEKVTVVEAGNFDYGWRNFRDKHLGPELKAMQNRKFETSDIRAHINGKTAWATFAYRIKASFGERQIDAEGAGTMVMEKVKGEWRIVHYATSGKRRPQ